MLKDKLQKFFNQESPEKILPLEKNFAEQWNIDLPTNVQESEEDTRFTNATIEVMSKETEESVMNVLADEFLNKPISYVKKNSEHFIYLDSKWFDLIGVDGISLEIDDVFGTYEVLFGLRRKKNDRPQLLDYFNSQLGDSPKHSLLFNGEDGLWDVNFSVNGLQGFHEEMTIHELYQAVYIFVFHLHVYLDEAKTV
ncbi:branched-chain amino acid aminotransferase [Bacillus sp. 2205SS5-2]|uniref:branched-chain amino acid aminotransferase n=1 Tax=Bacillus sp. 2205SS5-2 TaxID=3109031 RepID=UPI0030077407